MYCGRSHLRSDSLQTCALFSLSYESLERLVLSIKTAGMSTYT